MQQDLLLMKLLYSIAAVALLLFSGCVTIIGTKTSKVHIASFPAGAQVLVNGEAVGITPYTGDIRNRRKNPPIQIKKAGYEPQDVQLESKITELFYLNGIFIPYAPVVDLLFKNAHRYKETYKEVYLQQKGGAKPTKRRYTKEDNFYIIKKSGELIFCQPEIAKKGVVKYLPIGESKRVRLKDNEVDLYKDIATIEYKKLDDYLPFYYELAKTKNITIAKKKVYTTSMTKMLPLKPEKPDKSINPFTVLLSKDSIILVQYTQITQSGGSYGGGAGGFGGAGGGYRPGGASKKIFTHLYIGGKFITKVDKDNYESVVYRYFGDSEIIKKLRKKSLMDFKALNVIGNLYQVSEGNI